MKISRIIIALALTVCMLAASVSAALMGDAVTSDSTKGNFKNLTIKTVANKVTVSGSVATAKKTSVSFYVTDGTSNIASRQVFSDASGTFEFVLVLNPERYDAENTASITVGAMGYNSRKIIGIPLYSQAELDGCVEDFKTITSGEELGAFFASYSEMLGITEVYNQDELDLMYSSYEENPPADVEDCDSVITSINNLLTYITDYRAFFAAINEAGENGDGGAMKNLLTVTYAHIIPFSTEVILVQNESAMYRRLAESYTEAYTSFADIEAAFAAARDAQAEVEAVNGAVTDDREFSFAEEWKISVNGNRITISGRVDDLGIRNIVFHATDSNAENTALLTIYQVQTDQEGVFSGTFAIDPSRYGDQTEGRVRVSGYDVNTYQFLIPLYPADVLNEMTDEFKAISDTIEAKAFLDEYSETLAVGAGYNEAKTKILCELFAEKDYSDITVPEEVAAEIIALDETVNTVKTFIDKVNDYSERDLWAKMEKAIEEDFSDLESVSSTYAELKELSEGNKTVSSKGVYLRMVGQSFECVQDIIDAYNIAFEEQKEFEAAAEETKPSRPSGGGGGGGGGFSGGSTNVEIAPDIVPEPEKAPLEEEKKPVETFNDLEGYDWAKDSINTLRNIGVLKGDGNGAYRPGDSVTREEFLAMLLRTCYVDAKSGGTNVFADVKNDGWYFDTVCTAYALGVTKGKGDGTFGIGENVIRADMAAMAARLIRSKGLLIEEKTPAKVFGDYTEIPEYAYNDVITFQQAGIVQGDELGNFNPNNPVTRAEAAVFFHNIFKYIEGQI